FALHAWRRWTTPRRAELVSRRNALRLLGLGAAGIGGWAVAELIANARQTAASPRRFTGSREQGSFTGIDFPVTQSVGQGRIVINPETWRLRVSGAVAQPLALSYADLLALPSSEVMATLDCTGGWYTRQVWRGVTLADLLRRAGVQPGAVAVELKDVSGYPVLFTMSEVGE